METIRCAFMGLFVAEVEVEGEPLGKPLWFQKKPSIR